MPRERASATTARETGCSDPKPHDAATASSASSDSPGTGRIFGDDRRAHGNGAGLVEDQRIDIGRALEKIGALDEDAKSRRDGHRRHHGGGARHHQRGGRRDHQHGDRARKISREESVLAARVSTSGSHTPARRSKSRNTGTEVRSTSARSSTTRPSTVSAPAPRT